VSENKQNAALRELGALLKSARVRAGKTQRVLAAEAGFPAHSRISGFEKGLLLPKTGELERLLNALGLDDSDERERILGLATQAAEGPGQLRVGPAFINETLVQVLHNERNAWRITVAGPLLIPGLLQTTDVARAVIGDSIEAQPKVALRAGRRDILTRRDPVELRALIDSEALLRPIVPPAQLADQLRHIMDMAQRSNITVQIVMSTTPGYHPMLSGQFELIEFRAANPVVFMDTVEASVELWEPERVAVFQEAADYLCKEVAMSPEESLRLMAEIVSGMETM
jgi:transcriptional regulator with XRE-family HTH domain